MRISHLEILEAFNKVLHPLMLPCKTIAIFDFPNYGNVGDSAIWMGTLSYLRTYHKDKSITHINDIRSINKNGWPNLALDCIILITGGGNFGDLWPDHQYHRLEMLKQYPKHCIIQLPQSIYFSKESELSQRSWEEMSSHGNFYLLVRDKNSLQIATQFLDKMKVSLLPDMAYCLTLIPSSKEKSYNILGLLRNDKEKITAPIENKFPITDWLSEPNYFENHLLRWAQRLRRVLGQLIIPTTIDINLYNSLAAKRLRRGIELISSANIVITDRLHVHIVSSLLNHPHVVLDNSYQKISAFRKAWPKLTSGAELVGTLEEAFALAKNAKQPLNRKQLNKS